MRLRRMEGPANNKRPERVFGVMDFPAPAVVAWRPTSGDQGEPP